EQFQVDSGDRNRIGFAFAPDGYSYGVIEIHKVDVLLRLGRLIAANWYKDSGVLFRSRVGGYGHVRHRAGELEISSGVALPIEKGIVAWRCIQNLEICKRSIKVD